MHAHSDLPDNPDVAWPVDKVADIVLEQIEKGNIGAVRTHSFSRIREAVHALDGVTQRPPVAHRPEKKLRFSRCPLPACLRHRW